MSPARSAGTRPGTGWVTAHRPVAPPHSPAPSITILFIFPHAPRPVPVFQSRAGKGQVLAVLSSPVEELGLAGYHNSSTSTEYISIALSSQLSGFLHWRPLTSQDILLDSVALHCSLSSGFSAPSLHGSSITAVCWIHPALCLPPVNTWAEGGEGGLETAPMTCTQFPTKPTFHHCFPPFNVCLAPSFLYPAVFPSNCLLCGNLLSPHVLLHTVRAAHASGERRSALLAPCVYI